MYMIVYIQLLEMSDIFIYFLSTKEHIHGKNATADNDEVTSQSSRREMVALKRADVWVDDDYSATSV